MTAFDIRLLYWINSRHSAFGDALLWWVSASADLYLIWLLAGAAALWADGRKGVRVMLAVLLALACTYVSVDLVLKPLIARPRPFVALEGVRCLAVSRPGGMVRSVFAFPSGHCASAAAASVVLGGFYRITRLPLSVFTALMAYSRVYVGMHYPSDCLAGIAVGAACGIVALRVVARRPPA